MELLNSIGVSVVAFVFVLGVMIFIHELGHHLVAKFLGIRVDVFSLGFGPRLFGFRRGDTDYRVSLLPLGGYVKMAGEHYGEEGLSGSPDEFLSRPKMHRFAVAVAGPIMNIGLAIVLLAGVYMIGVQVPSFPHEPPLVGGVQPDSPAARAGFQVRDRILSIGGEEVSTWRQADITLVMSPRDSVTFTVQRNGQLVELEVTPGQVRDLMLRAIGIEPFVPFVVRDVLPDSPAEKAGIQPGDEILQVLSEQQVAYGLESQKLIADHAGRSLTLMVRRGESQVLELDVVPAERDGQGYIGTHIESPTLTEQYGFFPAFWRSLTHNYEITVLTFTILGRLVTGRASLKTMSGPIEIARFSGVAASLGLVHLVTLMALISLQLGIFNLLPIPILDGGVIALLAVEGVLGRDLSVRVKERILQVGFIFLILLMGVVIFNDLVKNISVLN